MPQDTSETPVIFRVIEGEVIAIFPAEPASVTGYDVSSYMHVGQHGGCDAGIINRSRLAAPEEYALLKAELESAPYGYRLKVCKRWSRAHRDAAEVEQRRLRAHGSV